MSVQTTIEQKLTAALQPLHLEVVNESSGHNVAAGSETHFKVVIVSDVFAGKRPVQRHQLVYATLAEELQSGVHALSIHTHLPAEWPGQVPASPDCLGVGR